jgi:hypothetical protein
MKPGKWHIVGLALIGVATAALALAPARSPSGITQARICEVLGSSYEVAVGRGADAWVYPAEARRLVAAHRWRGVGEDRIRSCRHGARALTMTEDGALAQVTRGNPDSETGSMETCLLRNRGAGWQPVGCRLDAVN